MKADRSSSMQFRPSLSLVLLAGLLAIVWLAGGASRADALGQAVVRTAAWVALIVALLFRERPSFGAAKPVFLLAIAIVLVVAAQLVPLPPALWQGLPGREALTAVTDASVWRPWSLAPDATANALASLVVPVAVLLLAANMREEERRWLPGIVLGLVAASTLVGLLQFSGAGFNNPFVNDAPGEVSGTFANRNHFALFLAIGCLIAPAWAFLDGRRPGWRASVALGLVFLFTLTILASGSRAGIVVGLPALTIAGVLAWRGLKRGLKQAPRWVIPALAAAAVVTIAILILLSVASGRAQSIDRALMTEGVEDMRGLGLPIVLAMVSTYFPAGAGWGSFDPAFRIDEPDELLQLQYFNHAHNDLLEILLDGGLPGLLLLAAAVGWWIAGSWRVWRPGSGANMLVPRLGSAIILLVLVASTVDYPARTPIVMTMIVLAALWLSEAKSPPRPALPARDQHL